MEFKITYLELVLIGFAFGAIVGLIPLFLGIFKKELKLGIFGFLISAISGAIWTLLSLISVGIFIWLILKNANKLPVENVVNENLIEVSHQPSINE